MSEPTSPVDFPPTGKTRIKRKPNRAHYDRATVHAILDAGLMCHVGYVIDGQPYVTPTACWRAGDHVYWHGSSASRMVRHLETGAAACVTVSLFDGYVLARLARRMLETLDAGVPACLTVAHLDGIVFARSGFHHSLRYRSVMMFGTAHRVEDDRKAQVLEDFMERIAPGRWAELRPPTEPEMKGTAVFFMDIEEAVAKVRDGGCLDKESDMQAPVWAGVLPFATVAGPAEPDPQILPGIPLPGYVKGFRLG